MGRKDKKKHKRRSRSPSPEEHISRSKDKKRSQRSPISTDSDSDSSSASTDASSSPQRKSHKKSRHRSDSTERRRDKDRSSDKKKKRKRSRSRSRERSRDGKKKRHRDDDRELQTQDVTKQKELMKALETPEEKRARRLAKKEAKEKKRMANMGWDDEYAGYTNGDNPFGDVHLLETFRWNKKLEKEGVKNISKEEMERRQKQALLENRIELEKVKKRRLEREREMEERDRERERLQREKEAEYFSAWEKQEDTFHLQQAKLRSKIRIEDSRAKPIDLLAQYISPDDEDFTLEMHEPYTCLNGLTITDLEDLLEDIKVYLEMEEGRNADFWRDITIITEDEIEKLRKIDPTTKDFVGERRSGINASVADDVAGFLKVKKLSQLAMLEAKIKAKLQGGEGVDVGYWESFLAQLKAHMARTRLRERHQEQLRAKLFKLKQQQGIESAPLFPIMPGEDDTSPPGGDRIKQEDDVMAAGTSGYAQPGTSGLMTSGMMTVKEEEEQEQEEEDDEPVITEEDVIEQNYTEYEAGSYSPAYISPGSLDPDTIIYTEEDDAKRLEYSRRRSLQTGTAKEDADDALVKRAREGMNDDEAQFSVEVPLEKQTVLWSDKYRPRKPRFFNRVHTGFEWNKYNQTHYDIDNPPPKIVQGYKFNIFYPDLIDKTKTPEYFLTPCNDNKDFAELRFHSGPPYEDIAFKIVNREWEYSYKRGFRCQFHNNIFQLWFHFKRYRYRR